MKAAVFEGIGKIDVKDIAVPQCPEDGLLLKVAACAICGTDVKCFHHGHRLVRPPRVIGHELSGTIEEVGKKVEGYKAGERVALAPAVPCGYCPYCRRGQQTMCDDLVALGYQYDGGFEEYMAVPERLIRTGCVNRIPDTVSFEEAAIAEPLACCINAHELCHVSLGHTVVIIGAGPIGCFNLQLARANGATKTILIDISAERLKMASVIEHDVSINGKEEDAVKRVMEETDGIGADVVIVACPSGAAQEQSLSMVAKRGVVDFFGGLPKDKPCINFDSNLLHYREFFVVGNHGSAPRHNAMALDLIGSGKINASKLITHRLSIDEILEGIAIAEKAQGLKVIISGGQ